jgi:protein phosphatase
VNIDLEGPYDAAAGDVFLLCSDGLSGQICDAELGALLHCLAPEDVVQTLVDLANLRGGPDNISVIVARLGGEKATGKVQSQELTETHVGSSSRRRRVLLQTVGVVALFALAFCLVNEFWIAAAVSAGALATAVGLLLSGRAGQSRSCAPTQSLGGPYGNGPYRETSCEPNRKVVDSLAAIVAKLRGLPTGHGYQIDWKPLDEGDAAARAAADRGDFCTAIRSYAAGIRAIMQQLRQHRTTPADDSGVYRA